jgi:hypothetical protein
MRYPETAAALRELARLFERKADNVLLTTTSGIERRATFLDCATIARQEAESLDDTGASHDGA